MDFNYENIKPITVKGTDKQKRLTVNKDYKDYIKLNDKVIILKYEDYQKIKPDGFNKLKKEFEELQEQNKKLNVIIKQKNKIIHDQENLIKVLKSNFNKSEEEKYKKITYRLLGNVEVFDNEKKKLIQNNKLIANNIIKDIILEYDEKLNNLSFFDRLKGKYNFNISTTEYSDRLNKEIDNKSKDYFNIDFKGIEEDLEPKPLILDNEN